MSPAPSVRWRRQCEAASVVLVDAASGTQADVGQGLERRRPGLVGFVLERLAERYGAARIWERRLDPTSELILTILTQNSADIERRGGLRDPARRRSLRVAASRSTLPGAGLGRRGLPDGRAPDGGRGRAAGRSRRDDQARRSGVSKSPRDPGHPRLREERGDHSLEFLATSPLEATRVAEIQLGSARRPLRCCCCSDSASLHPRRPARRAGRPARRAHPSEGDGRRCPRPLPGPGPAGTGPGGPRQPDPARASRVSTPNAPMTPAARSRRAAASFDPHAPSVTHGRPFRSQISRPVMPGNVGCTSGEAGRAGSRVDAEPGALPRCSPGDQLAPCITTGDGATKRRPSATYQHPR